MNISRQIKKISFLNLILICVIILTLFAFAKAFCEDEDTIIDGFCENKDLFHYYELIVSAVLQRGIFFEHRNDTIPVQPTILFLERQEKSPPACPQKF